MATGERTSRVNVTPITHDGGTEEHEFHPSVQTRRTDAAVRITKSGGAIGDPHRPFLWFVDESTESGRRVVDVAIAQPTWQEELIGTVQRTFNGPVRSGIRRRMRRYHVVTPPLPLDEASPLINFLRGRPPLRVGGRMFYGALGGEGDTPFPCHIGAMNGGYNRGGRIGGSVGELDIDERQLASIEFDIIAENR